MARPALDRQPVYASVFSRSWGRLAQLPPLAYWSLRPSRIAQGLILVALLNIFAFSQNDGIPTFSTIEDHGVDAINLQNLDVLINPPVRDKAGAIPFHFGMIGNSNCDLVTDGAGDATEISCGLIPTKGFLAPGVAEYLTETTTLLFTAAKATSTHTTCHDGSATTKYTNWIVYDFAGTSHSLPVTDFVDSKQCLAASFTDYPRDNSGYTLAVTGGTPVSYTIYSVDGTSVSGGGTNAPTTVTDANGNAISINYGANPRVITDTLNTTALTYLPGNPYNNGGGTYNWSDISGTQRTISQTYQTLNFYNDFGCVPVLYSTTGAGSAVIGITYPDGAISFGYEINPIHSGYYTGRIHQITYKTGGIATYTYSGGTNGIDCTYIVPPTMSRQTQDGTTTYSWALVNNGNGNYGNTTTVLDPGKNKTIYTFTGLTATGNAPYPTMQALTQVQ